MPPSLLPPSPFPLPPSGPAASNVPHARLDAHRNLRNAKGAQLLREQQTKGETAKHACCLCNTREVDRRRQVRQEAGRSQPPTRVGPKCRAQSHASAQQRRFAGGGDWSSRGTRRNGTHLCKPRGTRQFLEDVSCRCAEGLGKEVCGRCRRRELVVVHCQRTAKRHDERRGKRRESNPSL